MIGFVGLSHLGIIYSVATAAQGLDVLAYDPNAALCEELSQGRFPVLEPGLSATFSAHRNRLTFTANAKDLNRCTVVFVSLDVATDAQNQSDLSPLERLIAECGGDAIGGILALPIADTVKRVAKDEAGTQRVAGTEDRTQLWLAQTPQMFRVGLLAQALKDAKGPVTDEASAIESLGLRPRLVTGSRENLKVTYAEDLAIAEAILKARA